MADQLIDFLSPILKDIENTRYSELASSTIIVFDYLITLGQEIQYIWKARWTIGKVLFFLNRYYTLFSVLSATYLLIIGLGDILTIPCRNRFNNYALFSPSLTDNTRVRSCMHLGNFLNWRTDGQISCVQWFKWQGWTGLISAALAETILQLRLYALYYGNKKVLTLMIGFFISALTASAAIMGTVLRGIQARSNLIPGTKFCIVTSTLPHFYAFWIPILSFETFLCVLALIRGYRSYRDNEIRRIGNLTRRRQRRASHQTDAVTNTELNVLEILLRDSVGYFIVMFATYLTTTIIWILGPYTVIEIPIGFTVALSSVIANRLLLNLRDSHKNTSSAHGPNRDMSALSHSSIPQLASVIDVTTTIEDSEGRELVAYELHALRNLKISVP